MRIFFYLFLALPLFSNELLIDIYQKQGVKEIEKVFDKELSSKKHWEKRLQNIDTRFGYFEGIDSILACSKKDKSLKLYSKDNNNSFRLNVEFYAFVGEKEGDKQKEGDLKTPIGVYKILQRLDKVDSFYGPLAYVTSYPNTYDKVQGKNGSGIWLHGLPFHQERDDYTKGCIAINNSNIEDIKDKIDFTKTLVYINQDKYVKLKKENLVTLLSKLFTWREAWKYSNTKKYLSFYDKEFKRHDGMNLTIFTNYKKRVFAKNEEKQISFSNINIIPYPSQNSENVFLISFYEAYNSPSYTFSGTKELYVHLNDKSFTILAEK